MVLVLIALLAQWYRHDSTQARRHDQRAARNDDRELTAYNQMLERLADRDRTP